MIVRTINHRGFTIEVVHDEHAESPREWDNLGKMVCWHGRYDLGDKHGFDKPSDFYLFLIENRGTVTLPVYLYDHSGITISTTPFSCRWDSGKVGYIYMTREQIRKEYGWQRLNKVRLHEIKARLRSEVITYDNYITGNVYGWKIEAIDESVWGYIGDPETSGLIEDVKRSVDAYISNKIKVHTDRLKVWIRAGVPLIYRKPLILQGVAHAG